MGEANLTDDELKRSLRSLKPNERLGKDSIFSNVVKETSDIFFIPLRYIFNLSLKREIFPGNLKIAKVSLIYKKDVDFLQNNYRPITDQFFSVFLNY